MKSSALTWPFLVRDSPGRGLWSGVEYVRIWLHNDVRVWGFLRTYSLARPPACGCIHERGLT
jgi:hypothetical protein